VERVNLFSDTQTRPTDGMRRAIAAAEVGDEQRFADPTTTRLEERVAELLGHEAALFLPSGTMCNQIAIRLHTRPGGDELIAAANSHPVNYEAGGPALFANAMVRTIDTPTGVFEPDQLAAAIRPAADRYAPRSRLVSVEQTTNVGGGRVWPLDTVRAVVDVAHEHDMRAHLDGARLMNAVVATGTNASDWAAGFDTAWIDFTKGLGAPVGAVLAGSRELIDEAWRYKQMIGGALRQSGIVAAACLYALDHHVDRLAEDHDNARALAQGLAELPGFEVQAPDTNIVMADVADAPRLVGELWDRGVEVTPMAPTRIRCVTHLDVDAAGIERALAVFREVGG
jgi:threonine aldolase